jgi:effector-binding domain-containing protein
VEVTRPFEADGEVVFVQAPAGDVASTLHDGSYDTLGDAYAALDAWGKAQGRTFAGTSWEIYGDPGDDPSGVEIQVVYLLALPRGGHR